MIKLLDLLNESYNPNIYQVECTVAITAGNRPIPEILSDIRAVPGVTVVDTIDSDYNTEEGRHLVKLSIKIDPSPFNPFDSSSYNKILSDIKKLPDIRGAKFTSNPIVAEGKLHKLIKEILQEKADRCKRIADRKYDKPSAYKSGAIVRCRKGEIWKDLKEIGDSSSQPYSFDYYGESDWGRIYGFDTEKYPYTVEIIPDEESPNEVSIRFYVPNENNPDIEDDAVVTNEGNLFKVMTTISSIIKKDIKNNPEVDTLIFAPSKKSGEVNNISRLNLYLKYIKKENPNAVVTKGPRPQDVKIILKEDESLHKWFKRKGPKGKEGGWVDCNTCRDGKCKSCGRKKGEKRAKYPSCRPTPSQCKSPGKDKKWGKTK